MDIKCTSEVKVGDTLIGTTMTYSQKWLIRPGYEEYNRTVTGVVVEIKGPRLEDVMIDIGGEIVPLVADPGTSGMYWVQKIVKA